MSTTEGKFIGLPRTKLPNQSSEVALASLTLPSSTKLFLLNKHGTSYSSLIAYVQDCLRQNISLREICWTLASSKLLTIWRVNNGQNIQIWRDNWIPRSNSLNISRPAKSTRIRRVSDLIHKNPWRWNEALIKQIFFQHETEEILSIRIAENEDDHILTWHFEKSGLF